LAADHLFAQLLISTARYFKSSLAEGARKVQALRERYEALEDSREARGIILLREWLSAEQQAQFDATKSFEVIGCVTVESTIASSTAQRPISRSLTTPATRSGVGVLFRQDTWSQGTSCLPKKSR